MIKTIIFDLGGVYFTDGTKGAIQNIATGYGLSEEQVASVLKGELGTKYRIGEVTADEFWNQAKAQWNIEAPSDELAAIWLEEYVPIEGTAELIDKLQKAGYELIFLSDNVKERVEYLEEKYGFLQRFQGGVFSHEVHTRKPDPAIYGSALELASHPAEECVYIDDKPELLEPARELGMAAVTFKNPEQLGQELHSLGVEVEKGREVLREVDDEHNLGSLR